MAGNIVRGAIIPGGWRNATGNYGWACRLSVAGGGGDLSVWSHPDQAVVTGPFGYPAGYVVWDSVRRRGSLQFMLPHQTSQANGTNRTGH